MKREKEILQNIKKLANWRNFMNKDGSIKVEMHLMMRLMKTLGLKHLKTESDIWLLCYRTYIVFGSTLLLDGLFLDETFFGTHYNGFEESSDYPDFTEFALNTYESGKFAEIKTYDLCDFIGLNLKGEKHVPNKIFEEELILKTKDHWTVKQNEIVMFPYSIRDGLLRQTLMEGGKVSKKIKEEAAFFANQVTKYL